MQVTRTHTIIRKLGSCRKFAKATGMIQLTPDVLFFANTLVVAQAENLLTGVLGAVFFMFSIWRIGILILIHIGRVRKKQTITRIEEDQREQEQSKESSGDVERN